MRKYRIVIMLLIMSLLLVPGGAMAVEREGLVYVALGDSIAYGTGASEISPYLSNYVLDTLPPGYGYTDRLHEHFSKVFGGGEYYNYSENGQVTGALRYYLSSDPTYAPKTGEADVLTISIGSNDLLLHFRKFIADNPAYRVPEYFALMLESDPLPHELESLMWNMFETVDFHKDRLMLVMRVIRIDRGSDAKILVNNLYNPFKEGTIYHEFAEYYIVGMNNQILAAQEELAEIGIHFTVVDVKSAFDAYNNKMRPLVHGIESPTAVHPTDQGYQVIYHQHKKSLDIKELLD